MSLAISGNISISGANLLMQTKPGCPKAILEVAGCIAENSSSELAQPERLQLDSLEQTLKDHLSDASPETFRSICKAGFLSGQIKMIEVCRRVASFSQKESTAVKLAQDEATFTPKPPRTVEQLSESLYPLLRRIGRLAGQAFHIIYTSGQRAILMLVLPFYFLIMDPLSSASNPEALEKGPIKILKSVYKPIKLLTAAYYGLFETTEKAHTVALVILATGIAIYFIHRKFRLGVPEELDRKELFQNISSKVVTEGIIEQVEGRDEEKKLLKSAWQVPAGGKYKIGLLIGPTGVGKTEFVNGLAWESVNDESSFVYGKTIYSINTILLTEQKDSLKYFRQEILPSIEGHEDDVILFFDEGHSAGEKKGKGPLLELFKTEILARNIRCLLATTTEEYDRSIAHNKAFVDRSDEVTFNPLSDTDMVLIILKMAARDENRIAEFDPNAYPAIVKVSANDPAYKTRSNPRKTIDLYNKVSGNVSSWKPTKLKEILNKLNQEIPLLNAQCLASSNNDPDWSSSDEGQTAIQALREKRAAAQALEERIEKQHQQFQALTRNLQLEPVYRAQMYKAVHIVADLVNPPSAQAKLEYLFIKHVVRPALKAAILEQVEQFKTDFPEEENIPIKIDAALIQKRFPSSFSPEEVKKAKELSSDSSDDIN